MNRMYTPALFSPAATRASGPLRQWWRALVAKANGWRPGRGAADRDAAEREAFAGLSEHVLRDVGASPRLMADAARCPLPADAARDRLFY